MIYANKTKDNNKDNNTNKDNIRITTKPSLDDHDSIHYY